MHRRRPCPRRQLGLTLLRRRALQVRRNPRDGQEIHWACLSRAWSRRSTSVRRDALRRASKMSAGRRTRPARSRRRQRRAPRIRENGRASLGGRRRPGPAGRGAGRKGAKQNAEAPAVPKHVATSWAQRLKRGDVGTATKQSATPVHGRRRNHDRARPASSDAAGIAGSACDRTGPGARIAAVDGSPQTPPV